MRGHLTPPLSPGLFLGAAWLVIGLAACAGPSPPPPPPPPEPPLPPSSSLMTVSGTVLEFRATGEQVPVANLRLKVRSGDGAVRATPLADTVTDEHGRYTIKIDDCNPGCVVFFQPDPQSEYRFLCDWYPFPVRYFPGHTTLLYLPVVHTTWSGNRPPSRMSFFYSAAWGTVSEQIDGSLQPVAGATVTLDDARWEPPATTGPNGFFMICSTAAPDQGPRTLAALKTGYNPVTRDIEDGGSNEVHLQLTRK